MATPFPTIAVAIAFATLPGAVTPTWEDVTPYVQQISIQSARRNRELDRFEAATCDLTLDNSDARFHPNNPSSPYAPNVLPMRRIRVRATWNAVAYDLFNGYVEDWPPASQYPAVGQTVIKATDGFLALAAAAIDSSPYEIEVRADEPVAWWRLSDPSNTGPMVDSSGNGHDGQYQADPGTGGASLVVGQSTTSTHFDGQHNGATFDQGTQQRARYDSTDGTPISGYPFSAEFMFNPDVDDDLYLSQLLWLDGAQPSQFDISYDPDTGLVGWQFNDGTNARNGYSAVQAKRGQPHHVMFVATAANNMKLYVDGVDGSVVSLTAGTGAPAFPTAPHNWTIGNSHTGFIGSGALIGEVALYDAALSAGRVAAHATAALDGWAGDLAGIRVGRILDAAGWPAAQRDIDTGQSTMQAQSFGAALDALQTVADAELGAIYCKPNGDVKFRDRHALLKAPYTTSVATFTDQTAGANYEDVAPDFAVDMIRNIARISRAGGAVQQAKNDASIGKYFKRKYEKSGLILERDSDARDQANYIVNRYPEPPFRFGRLELNPAGNENTLFPLILGLAHGDRVAVEQQPPGFAAPDSEEHHVDGWTHDIAGLTWRAVFQLTPADTQTYFVLGTSELGSSDVLGY